ncbi:MAG: hypothetical protein JSS66_12030 [Armatimonadetes bacterium]|nr:hypothetical protein [Armatimonadota bacterium]
MQDLETRVAALERTNRRYRLGLTVSTALLSIVCLAGFGQVGQQQGQQTWPRNLVVDTISAQSITAYSGTINQLGSNRATIQYVAVQDGAAESLAINNLRNKAMASQSAAFGQVLSNQYDLRGGNGANVASLVPAGNGAALTFTDGSGRAVMNLSGGENGSLLRMGAKGGWNAIEVSSDDKTGLITTFGASGKQVASLGHNDKGDGTVVAHARNGNRGAWLTSNDDGDTGRIIVQRQDGTPLARLEGDAKSGYLTILDGKDEMARFPAK